MAETETTPATTTQDEVFQPSQQSRLTLQFKSAEVETEYVTACYKRFEKYFVFLAIVATLSSMKFASQCWDIIADWVKIIVAVNLVIRLHCIYLAVRRADVFLRYHSSIMIFYVFVDTILEAVLRAYLGAVCSIPPRVYISYVIVFFGLSWIYVAITAVSAISVFFATLWLAGIDYIPQTIALNESLPFSLYCIVIAYLVDRSNRNVFSSEALIGQYHARLVQVLSGPSDARDSTNRDTSTDATSEREGESGGSVTERILNPKKNKLEQLRNALMHAHEVISDLKASMMETKRALDEKDRFLATMSHEIRTPLHGIVGVAALLDESKHLVEKDRVLVHTVRASGHRLMAAVNDILDFSHMQWGALKLIPETFEMQELLETVMQAVGMDVKTGVIASLMVNTPKRVNMRADPARLQQILVNLLSNAIKFTNVGSVVLKVSIDDKSERDVSLPSHFVTQVKFRCKDTGIGMSADGMDKVFAPFQQTEGGIRRSHEGLGLGLAITRQLIHLYGGSIAYVSTVGKGTSFTAKLPLTMVSLGDPIVPKDKLCVPFHLDTSMPPALYSAIRDCLTKAGAESLFPLTSFEAFSTPGPHIIVCQIEREEAALSEARSAMTEKDVSLDGIVALTGFNFQSSTTPTSRVFKGRRHVVWRTPLTPVSFLYSAARACDRAIYTFQSSLENHSGHTSGQASPRRLGEDGAFIGKSPNRGDSGLQWNGCAVPPSPGSAQTLPGPQWEALPALASTPEAFQHVQPHDRFASPQDETNFANHKTFSKPPFSLAVLPPRPQPSASAASSAAATTTTTAGVAKDKADGDSKTGSGFGPSPRAGEGGSGIAAAGDGGGVTADDATPNSEFHQRRKKSWISLLSQTPAFPVSRIVPHLRVMVVDDNAINRRVGAQLLKRCGLSSVSVAEDGAVAVKAVLEAANGENAEDQRFDVLLMDLHMPVMDGTQATHEIQTKLNKDVQPVIIMCTADVFASTVNVPLRLSKPFTVVQLQASLEESVRLLKEWQARPETVSVSE